MAAELVHAARSKKVCKPERLRFSYYIAGSGDVGPTTLASSFLLLGKEAIAYNKGEEIKLKPYSGVLNIDFGKGVGKKDVYLLNLPEVKSAFKYLNVPTVSARFGSDPIFWNWGMHYFANFLPIDILRDKNNVMKLVEVIDPIVRTIDGIVGECVSMRVDLQYSNGQNILGLFTHRKLSLSVGYAATAFVLAILRGQHTARRLVSGRARGNSDQSKEVASRACNSRSNQLCDEQVIFVPT
ncbi:hypothetical protein SEVIR_7G326300v4 [Setaria viridis]|uniref:Uncharacterized protein n=1 Tax=Setaria viridis TaxID=4556 RepID=A0A4U6U126_SETVI|nr:hypothetical protein SEVIR_7G326300v2 [Setaria viridis]